VSVPGLPKVSFNPGIAQGAAERFDSCVVITMPEPWELARAALGGNVRQVAFLTDVEEASLQALVRDLPPAEGVLGIGGGSSLDAAKYVAWTRGSRLVLIPTILSVDACVTNAVAVRTGMRVRYVGDITAEEVLIDYELLRRAPPHLNRAGIGDILSIHTALADWRSGAALGGPTWNDAMAAEAGGMLARLERVLPDIRDVREAGMRELTALFVAETELCLRAGHSRPEEGTEHYLAYCIESVTRRGFVHGELVCLCILIMSVLQGNSPGRAARMIRDAGVRTRPALLGLTEADLTEALCALTDYVRAEGLFPSAVTEAPVGAAHARELVAEALRLA
jgi:glycerol-1-phosphate dehydrogenase [NAD(P)+]